MTVALSDVVILRRLLEPLVNAPAEEQLHASPDTEVLVTTPSERRPFSDWSQVVPLLTDLHWERKGLASTVNILSVALYDLFGAEGSDNSVCGR